MVKLNRNPRWLIRAADVIGGVVVATLALIFAWLMFVRADRTADEIAELRHQTSGATSKLEAIREETERHRSTLKVRRAQLARTGELPTVAPIEEYFRELSQLAADNNLRVMRHNPLPSRSYPGLLERRYTYEVAGATTDVARFFRAIEDSDFWADIAYLKLETRKASSPSTVEERVASLTISVFSAAPTDVVPGQTRG